MVLFSPSSPLLSPKTPQQKKVVPFKILFFPSHPFLLTTFTANFLFCSLSLPFFFSLFFSPSCLRRGGGRYKRSTTDETVFPLFYERRRGMDGMSRCPLVVFFIYTRGGKNHFSSKCLLVKMLGYFNFLIHISAMVDLRCIALEDFGLFFSFPTWWREREGLFVRCGVFRKLIETA